jgi:choline dehydrogenase-like flavoprotein
MSTSISRRARSALDAICDTFVPGGDGLPSATETGVPEALLALVSRNPRAAERKQVAQLLGLWDTRLLCAVAGGGVRRFTALSQEARERVLLSWADSRVVQRRAAFQALRKGTLLAYYGKGGANGERNPAWDAIGYPGPLGAPESPPAPGIEPLAVDGDTTLDCDVVVVGSGAGGGTAAAVLAQAGLDVVIVEAGRYFTEKDFDGAELSGFDRLYLNGGGMASADGGVGLLAGRALGGSTLVNYTFSFRTPDGVRREWSSEHGLDAVATGQFDRSLDAVWERIGVNSEHSLPSRRDESIREGLDKLGWEWQVMQRNVRGCTEDVCRLCHYGCQSGAKQSTLKTWVQDAHDAGARILVGTRAERVLTRRGAAHGIEARTSAGHRVDVRARAVVSACGALHTPVLLARSGVASKVLGKHLRLHPVLVVWGQFDEEMRPWEGMLSSTYSDRDVDMDGNGYGVKYEHVAIPPSILLSFAPWRGGRRHAELMQALPFTGGLGVLLRDHGVGEVRTGRDGEPVVRYRLTSGDVEHMRRGVRGAARVVEAMGARRIYSSHSKWVAYEPGARGDLDGFCRDADACGWGAGQAQMISFHIMGSARMGASPIDSVCDPTGQVWSMPNLYVLDASAFPTASGVNPMVTIEALAHMNARALAAQLGGQPAG